MRATANKRSHVKLQPMPHVNLISYGVPFRLQAEAPELLEQALTHIPHASTPDLDPPPFPAIFPLSETLRTDLMVHVAEHAPNHVFLHAGVVAVNGRAIVLPGPSFAGKTTLTAALVQAGATYYSDEYAVLTPAGLIEPYARDLQVRIPGFETQTRTPIERFHGHAGTAAIPASLIAFVDYTPHARWQPRELSPGMAVLQLLPHAIPVQRTPARVLQTLTALVAHARILNSQRDEAAPTAQHLLRLASAIHKDGSKAELLAW
jgi:hypothetical protein